MFVVSVSVVVVGLTGETETLFTLPLGASATSFLKYHKATHHFLSQFLTSTNTFHSISL